MTTGQRCVKGIFEGVIVYVTEFGAMADQTARANTFAFQNAAAAALRFSTTTLLFDPVTYNVTMSNVFAFNAYEQTLIFDGNGCTFLITADGRNDPYEQFIFASYYTSVTFQNFTVNTLNPLWIQGFYSGHPSSTSWQVMSSGHLSDPAYAVSYVIYWVELSDDLGTIVSLTDVDGMVFEVNDSLTPSVYTLSGIPETGNFIYTTTLGAPVVITVFPESYSTSVIWTVNTGNVVYRNLVIHGSSGITTATCGNVSVLNVSYVRGPGNWITSFTNINSITDSYGNVVISNSRLEWGLDDDADINQHTSAIGSPSSLQASAFLSNTSSSLLVWAAFDITGSAVLGDQYYMRDAEGRYVMNLVTHSPYIYTVTIANSTAVDGYYLVNINGSSSAISALPANAAITTYQLERALSTTLTVTGTQFGPGMSTGVYIDFTAGSLIQDCKFVDLLQSGLAVAAFDDAEGPQTINAVINSNLFTRRWDTSLGGNGPVVAPAINMWTTKYQTTTLLSAEAGANINLVISNNIVRYQGALSTYAFRGNAIALGGSMNVSLVNNTIALNSSSPYGYAVYIQSSANVQLCNNTFSQSTRYGGAVYVSSDSFNVRSCSPVPCPFDAVVNLTTNLCEVSDNATYAWNLPLNGSYTDVTAGGEATLIDVGQSGRCIPYFAGTFLPSGELGLAWLNPCGSNDTNPTGIYVGYATIPLNFTLQVWMKLASNVTGTNTIFGPFSWINFDNILYIITSLSSPPQLTLFYETFYSLASPATGNPTSWTLYTVTYNGTTQRLSLYVNASQVATIISAWTGNNLNNNAHLGYDHSSLPVYYSQFVGYNMLRTPLQIANDYVCSGSGGRGCIGCIATSTTAWTCSSCAKNYSLNGNSQCV